MFIESEKLAVMNYPPEVEDFLQAYGLPLFYPGAIAKCLDESEITVVGNHKIYLPRVKIVEASASLKKKRVNWLPKRRKIKN